VGAFQPEPQRAVVLRTASAETVGEREGQPVVNLYWVGGEYRFAPQFKLEAGFYNIDTYNRPEVGSAYWAAAYSLLADYQITHSIDTYLGFIAMEYSGVGLYKHAPVNAYPSNRMYGIGLRYRF
jgi:predicted porin